LDRGFGVMEALTIETGELVEQAEAV